MTNTENVPAELLAAAHTPAAFGIHAPSRYIVTVAAIIDAAPRYGLNFRNILGERLTRQETYPSQGAARRVARELNAELTAIAPAQTA